MKLFLAGAIPGVLMACLFSCYVLWRSIRNPEVAPRYRAGEVISAKERWHSLLDIAPIAAIILVVMVSIYRGWATPTEVAAVGFAAAVLVAILYRSFSLELLREAAISAVRFTSMILFVILGAGIFSFALFSWGLARETAATVAQLPFEPIYVLLIIMAMYLFLGMFIDGISMMVLTIGLVFPIILQLGFDGIWFGVVLVMLIEIGALTPPVGIMLYTIKGLVPDTTVGFIARGVIPFILMQLTGIAAITLFPQIALWLPGLMK